MRIGRTNPTMRAVALALACAASVLAAPAFGAATAHDPELGPDDAVVALAFENDTFAAADRHYTNGLRIGVSPGTAATPRALSDAAERTGLFPDDARYRTIFTLGQNMYTPYEIEAEEPAVDDRSWAGWLYASLALAGSDGDRSHSLELSLGVVGPSARAGHAQRAIHDTFGQTEPRGWDNQIADRPALMLSYQRRWRAVERSVAALGDLEAGLLPHLGISVGNVFTHAHVGATLRAGRRLGRDFGPPRIQPSIPGSGVIGARRGAWYGFAGVDLRIVGYDVFLEERGEGQLPLDVERLVADVQLGALVSLGDAKLAYTHVLRTDQYATQRGDTSFGAFSVSRSW